MLGKLRKLGTGKHPSWNCQRLIGLKRHTKDKRIQTKPGPRFTPGRY